MLPGIDVDLTAVPLAFLEAYPFAAFVLIVPVALRTRPRLIARDTDVTVRRFIEDVSPLNENGYSHTASSTTTVAWGNERWYQLTQGRPIGECLEPRVQNRLQAWVEGGDAGLGGEGNEGDLTFEMLAPVGVTLTVAKTIIPLSPPSTTHAFCILTSQKVKTPEVDTPLSDISNVSGSSTQAFSSGNRTFSLDSRSSISTTEFKSSSYPDSRLSMSTGPRSSTEFASSSLSISSPSSGSLNGSYFNSSLRTRDDRPRSKARRRSPRGNAEEKAAINIRAEEFWKLVEEYDWSATPLGPREDWKDAIDPVLSITFESRSADSVWLGPEFNLIYNKKYTQLVDHPACFGKPAKQVWSGVWSQVEPIANLAMAGTPTYREKELFLIKKYGPYDKFEEGYQTWRYVPIKGKDGSILGLFNQSIDVTGTVLLERRIATTRDLSEQMLLARSLKEYFEITADVLDQNKADAPFALFYRVQMTDNDGPNLNVAATLECTTGVPDGHPSAQEKIIITLPTKHRANFPNSDRLSSPTLSAISALSSGSNRIIHTVAEGSQWPIARALNTRQCVMVDNCEELIRGYPISQWDELPYAAIVVPICSDGSVDIPDAVLILGLNVRRPYDDEYDNWINSIRSHLTSSIISVKAYEAEQKVADDNARMEKAKAAWFRGAAHDLRSPLTLISGPVADVLDSTLTVTQRQALSTAQRNIERLMRLVNALMDFSRLEAGRMEGRFVPTDLGEYVTELASLFRPAVERLGMQFTIDVQPSDELVYIDPSLFETVISNIIGNALKYTDSGSITVRVRYSDHAEVSVIDTGVGIPQDELDQVTDWYHRATNAIHTGTQGSGLGLALAKELLRLHQGELIVQSQTTEESGGPHGSTFTARIPLSFQPTLPPTSLPRSPGNFGKYGMEVANEAVRWTRDAEEMSESLTESVSGTESTSKFSEAFLFEKSDVILVVDDNLDMRNYIKRIFAPYCKVKEASNGHEAFEMAVAKPPQLILSDMAMPKMNGMELLVKIKEHPDTRLTPIVLLSAIADAESRVEALLKGAEDYLAKPFKPKELVARVHLHLQVGKKRANLEKLYAERETELTVLSDSCPIGIIRGDSAGSLTYANAAWWELSGIPETESPDVWPDWVDPETRKRLLGEWTGWLSSDRAELRTAFRWSNGRSCQAIMIRLDQIKPGLSGVMGCLVDVTHEEQRLVEAEERRKAAEESKYQQELLIDLTSHEIRTPVSAILQCSSLVKENLVALKEQLSSSGSVGFVPSPGLLEDLEEDVEALESIYQCGLVQERIAGDVLSLARIQLDMLSLHDIEMDLRREAKKVLSVFASEAKMKKIDLNLEFGQTLEMSRVMSIKTDPVRLGQVVTNLISNAIRFTASSDIRRITVKYDVSFVGPSDESCALPNAINIPNTVPAMEDTPIWLFVSVMDTGPGMSPKELAVLFQRFAQGNKMIHTKYGGSGLGLFICRKITELLGGRIEVLSQLGQGTVFRFFIKTRTVAPPSALASYMAAISLNSSGMASSFLMTPSSSVASSRASSASSAATPPLDGGSEHILIVEDNIINQTVLKRQIVKAGLTCDVANNGLEALNLIRETQRQARRGGPNRKKLYDVVLMDLEMPVMDGLTAIKEIRQAESAGTMQRNMVMALTGNARQGQIDQALAAGMDDVVIKPYVLSDLLKKIRAMKVKRAELGFGEEV